MSPEIILPEGVTVDEAQTVAQPLADPVAEEAADPAAETGNEVGSEETAVELPAQMFQTEQTQLTLIDPREHPQIGDQPVIQLTLVGRVVSQDDDGEIVLSEPVALVTNIDPAMAVGLGAQLNADGQKATAWARKGLVAATPAMAAAIAAQADQVLQLRSGHGAAARNRRGR